MDQYNDFEYIDRSMMSGDSPAHHNRTVEAYDFSPNQSDSKPYAIEPKPLPLDGRSSPVATTSRDVGVQSGRADDKAKGEVQASVLVEPGGGQDKNNEDGDEKSFLSSPTLNNDEGRDERDDKGRRHSADNDSGGYDKGKDKKDRKDDKFRKNGNIDKLDGVFVPKGKKQANENEDENCLVKCLYVTMTCCECSIM